MAEVDSGEKGTAALERRGLMKRVGFGAASAVVLGAMGTGGPALTSGPAEAQSAGDATVFNFALNLEYLEAEYYLRASPALGCLPA